MNSLSYEAAIQQYLTNPTNASFAVLENIPEESKKDQAIHSLGLLKITELSKQLNAKFEEMRQKNTHLKIRDRIDYQIGLTNKIVASTEQYFKEHPSTPSSLVSINQNQSINPYATNDNLSPISSQSMNSDYNTSPTSSQKGYLYSFKTNAPFTEFYVRKHHNGTYYVGAKFSPMNSKAREQLSSNVRKVHPNKSVMQEGEFETKNPELQRKLLALAMQNGAISSQQREEIKRTTSI